MSRSKRNEKTMQEQSTVDSVMEKTDVLVVGGSAAGIVAATTGKSFHPDKDFMLIRKEVQAVVPCH